MTGHFASALARLEAAITAMSPRLPQEAPTMRMVRQLSAAEAAPREPEREVLEAVRQRLRAASLIGGEPDQRDVKRAPWVLWQGDTPAIGFPGLLDRIVAQAMRSPRTLRYLIEAWLRDFSPDAPKIESAGFAIQRLLAASPDARMQPWRAAQSTFRLFDASDGPARLARAILNAPQPVATVLDAACFADQSRAVSAYLRFVQAELLARLAVALARSTATTQLARACEFLSSGKALRFDDSRAAIATALCKPWFNTARSPDAELQREVKDFLVAHIGNPQLRPGRWAGAESEAALIKRWLARASLEVFFGLIADHALDAQWAYRQAFWSACLIKGAIDDAWLVLGANVHASARARRELGSDFGLLESAGATADQSVLLLRIGPLVLAEWSHNGSLRAWPVDQGPKLGRKEEAYKPAELRRPSLAFPPDPTRPGTPDSGTAGLRHMGASTGAWQRRAARLLARYAQITLRSTDWQPQ
jgi:hypothetical protein